MIILASHSEARHRLLTAAGVNFITRAHAVNEEEFKRGKSPRARAVKLARAKALSIRNAPGAALVIGSDQVMELQGEMIGRSRTLEELRVLLRRLRGRSHKLHAAVACAQDGQILFTRIASARLVMRRFSDAFLENYLAEQDVRDCLGGYRIEGAGIQLFDRIEGDSFVIQGLPLLPLIGFLRAKGLLAK